MPMLNRFSYFLRCDIATDMWKLVITPTSFLDVCISLFKLLLGDSFMSGSSLGILLKRKTSQVLSLLLPWFFGALDDTEIESRYLSTVEKVDLFDNVRFSS
ncbi:hypothetical protein Tco_0269279 [Tanacetum coccineum]